MSDTRKVGATERHLPGSPEWRTDADGFERAIVFEPGYNDPTPRGYGKHGMALRFLLRGPNGVTQFLMNTGWVPGERGVPVTLAAYYPLAFDLGYHARVPQYEGQGEYGGPTPCEYLGADCWYDGSGLNAEPVMDAFIREGEDAVWRSLRDEYDRLKAPSQVSS